MNIPIGVLNAEGMEGFRAWLVAPTDEAPFHLLTDPRFSDEAVAEWTLDMSKTFSTTYELGCYLVDEVFGREVDRFSLRSNHGMWAWISLALIKNLLKRGRSTKGSPFDVPHYMDAGPRLGYRLIARTAWELVHLHEAKARVALSSRKSAWGDLAEQMASRQEIYAHPGFWTVAESLYLSGDGAPKQGVATVRKREHRRDPKSRVGLGAARRLVTSFGQFERTYLLREMNADEILEVLPKEYERWSAKAVKD